MGDTQFHFRIRQCSSRKLLQASYTDYNRGYPTALQVRRIFVCCYCCSPLYHLVSCCQIVRAGSWWSRWKLLLWLVDPRGHKQLVEFDVSHNQIGMLWCVVPLHTQGIGPMCLERWRAL